MRVKGVCYDTGREMMGQDWRPDFDLAVVRREIEIIRNDLHCSAIRLQGRDLNRLVAASRVALEMGLDVWFSPELWDRSHDETCDYISSAAGVAQDLLDRAPGRVVLSVGSEVLLFTRGLVPGDNVLERLGNPKLRELLRSPTTQEGLASFVRRLAESARAQFRGPLTYASVGMERVDWDPFDFIGVDLYRGDPMFDRYPELLSRYVSLGKPVVNTEFGCCTFRGADRLGGRGWDVVDWSRWPPRLRGPYVYDQKAQADELTKLLAWNHAAGVYGTFVFTFIETGAGALAGKDARAVESIPFDLDLPRYSLVKSLPEHRLGSAYPDMHWEPKESFRAVAEFYAQ